MKFPDPMALDRALFMLPKCAERDAIVEALLDDAGEYGFFPRYQSLKTVGDLRRVNGPDMVPAAPTLRDICPDTFAWVFSALDAPEPTPIPAIEDGARAHAANAPDDPAQLLPILDQICLEGGKSHATFGDRLNRLDLPYIQSMRFQDAVAKIVIDPNHYDKVGALMREPDVRMIRAKVQLYVEAAKDNLKTAAGELDEILRDTEHLTSGERYKRSFDNVLPPEPAAPTMDEVTEEIRQIIHSASGDKTEVALGPKRPKTPKGKAKTTMGSNPAAMREASDLTKNPIRGAKNPFGGALADVLKDI